MVQIPTVLVGLGGIGCEIVDRLNGMLSEQDRKIVAVHGFDTDVNDIGQRQGLRGCITQTSERMTVGQCYEYAGTTVQDWCPPLSRELSNKQLTEGAGQIRCVSRLAYYFAMKQGRLNDLYSQIAHIFPAKGDETEVTPRIVIVCTLAGGTGSGMFLQTALYLRELLESHFGQKVTIVRGVFLLPDLLINTGLGADKEEHEHFRTNAYAALKELDAIIRNVSTAGHEEVSIKLEYRPDQIDAAGRILDTVAHNVPYDLCFLYDFENSSGANIMTTENYKEQIITALYLQLFTPVGSKNRSQEDNNILDSIKTGGMNRYCGTGVSRLVYPYDDIIEYLSCRWLTESLKEDWIRLDEEYQQELIRYERDLNSGIGREKPEMFKRYVELLDSYAHGDNPVPFYSYIYRSTRILDERKKEKGVKVERFFDAVVNLIESVLRNHNDFQDVKRRCTMDKGKLKKNETVLQEIETMEGNLEDFQDVVFRMIHELKHHVVQLVVGNDCHFENCRGGDDDFRLNSWMLNRGNPVHPVAARYMLYQLKDRIEKKVAELTPANQTLEKSIRNYKLTCYDVVKSSDVKETAEMRIEMALRQSFFQKMLKNDLKEFVRIYQDGSVEQQQRIQRMARRGLQEEVFNGILKAVNSLIEQWEKLFSGLQDERYTLLRKTDALARRHDETANPTIVFLRASRQEKEALWDTMRIGLTAGNSLSEDICREIYIGVYKAFCRDHFPWSRDDATGGATPLRLQNILLPWCRDQLLQKPEINLNVVEAFQRRQEEEGPWQTMLGALKNLALPFVPMPVGGVRSLFYWGINPESFSVLSETDQSVFPGTVVSAEAFPRNELICYQAVYGLLASDLPKFKGAVDMSDCGSYFTSYQKRINLLTAHPDETVTPHLDYRWHLPVYMPDLNREVAHAQQEKIDRAYQLGLIYGNIKPGTADGVNVWNFYGASSGKESVMIEGKTAGETFIELYRAMAYNPLMVDEIIAEYKKQGIADRKKFPDASEKHVLVRQAAQLPFEKENVRTILDAIVVFVDEEPAGKGITALTEQLLGQLIHVMYEYFLSFCGSDHKKSAKDKTEQLIASIVNESGVYTKAEASDTEHFDGWHHMIQMTLNTLPV